MLLLLLLLLSLIENIFPSKLTMKIAVIVILALLSCVQAAPVSHPYFRPRLHGVGDPGLVGLVSFVFTLWRTQNKRNLPH